jgi:hypothetical protein
MIDTSTAVILHPSNSMHYPANGILKANFVTCVSQIGPGTVIRMGFPDIHDAHIKHHYFGVVTIVTMQADATGGETPAVIRVHWGDDTFNDFCFLNSEDFSFRALVSCVNDFAVFRQGHLRGVDALQWSLIRKFESCVQAARPCCATIRFSSPRRTRPEIVMWHFAKNSTKSKLGRIISKTSTRSQSSGSSRSKAVVGGAAASCPGEKASATKAKDSTISFLYQVVSHVMNMRNDHPRGSSV